MRRSKKALNTAMPLFLLLPLFGCGLIETANLPHRHADTWRTFDPNDYAIETKRENGSTSYTWSQTAGFDEKNNVLPYWKKQPGMVNYYTAVKGDLNGTAYPVIFDTGCNPMIILSEKIVTENDLAVYFFQPDKKDQSGALVIADSLKVGSFTLTDYPCGLWRYRPQLRLFGLPVHEPRMIILPLEMMRQFNYFIYDNQQDEISFSKESRFVPADPSLWLSLPFRYEGLHLVLDVSIEGIQTTLMLDTGADRQLELSESVVQELFKKRRDFRKAWRKTVHSYGPYADGLTTAKQFTAKNLRFAGQVLDRVNVIYTNGNENKSGQGVIGAALFDKTVMVLDFEHHVMWVKKAKGSRFEE